MSASRRSPAALLGENIVLRVVVYYAALAAAALLLWPRLSPSVRHMLLDSYAPGGAPPVPASGGGARAFGTALARADAVIPRAGQPVVFAVMGATVAAFLLSLPVAWVYMLTRERKGYRQTVVHTLVLLPVVVAGVMVLVKTSLTLAFSLAGVVAAVRFRNSLDDSKDAVFLFLATGVGLAAGVQIDVAIVLSVLFNAATLLLFYTDFARTPPGLEGERAQRQMERAMAIANRTSQFVARIDDEVLRAMGPAQLDALAGRLRRRREDTAPDLPSAPEVEYDARIRLLTGDPDALRAAVEPVLTERVKRWRLEIVERDPLGDAAPTVGYHVRWKKGVLPADVLIAVRERAGPLILDAEVL